MSNSTQPFETGIEALRETHKQDMRKWGAMVAPKVPEYSLFYDSIIDLYEWHDTVYGYMSTSNIDGLKMFVNDTIFLEFLILHHMIIGTIDTKNTDEYHGYLKKYSLIFIKLLSDFLSINSINIHNKYNHYLFEQVSYLKNDIKDYSFDTE